MVAACGGPKIVWVPCDDLIRCLKPTDWLGRLYLSGTKSGKGLREYEKYLKPVLTVAGLHQRQRLRAGR